MKDRILKLENVSWKSLVDFQPKEFKARSKGDIEKLKKSFLEEGNLSCFYVWDNNGTLYTIDGHSRLNIFKLLESECVDIPEKVPCIFIKCDNKKEAKKALAIYNSKYGRVDQSSFFSFMEDVDYSFLTDVASMSDFFVKEKYQFIDYTQTKDLINQRKKAEKEIEESEESFTNLDSLTPTEIKEIPRQEIKIPLNIVLEKKYIEEIEVIKKENELTNDRQVFLFLLNKYKETKNA